MLDLAHIRKLADAATDGPWFYNSYSAVFSQPTLPSYDEWFATIPDGHTVERRGACPPCGQWMDIPCLEPSTYEHGCRYFSEDYRRDPLVAKVPSHHGDTAIEKRAADAEFIAAARELVPAMADEIERLRRRVDQLLAITNPHIAESGEAALGHSLTSARGEIERLRDLLGREQMNRAADRKRANEAARLSAAARDEADDLRRTIADLHEKIAIVEEGRMDLVVELDRAEVRQSKLLELCDDATQVVGVPGYLRVDAIRALLDDRSGEAVRAQ